MREKLIVFIFLTMLWPVLCSAKEYKIFTEPLEPVHYEEDGKIKGIATEIVAAIFAEADLPSHIAVYPWKRAYQMALEEKASFIYTINRTEKREKLFKWIGPILSKETNLYKLKSREDINIISFEDAKNYTTAVILGHSLTTRLVELGFREGKELITTPDKKVQIKVFLNNRSDLITGNQYTIYRSLKAEGYSLHDVEPALHITSRGYYLGANLETDDKIIERLRLANERVQVSGRVQEIVAKYMQ